MDDFLFTLPVFFVFVIVALLVVRPYSASERPLMWLSFFMHQLASIGHILIMDLYYGYGDIFAYAAHGRYVAAHLRADFFGIAPGLVDVLLRRSEIAPLPFPFSGGSTGSMQVIASFAMFIFNDSLYAACAAVAGIAFLSKLALYEAAKHELSDVSQRSLLVGCMLVPSTIFWSSVLLKEPIAMIGLCIAVYGWHRVVSGKRGLSTWAALALGSWTIILIKGYIFPVLGIGLAIWFLLRSFNTRREHLVFRLWHVAAAGGLIVLAVAGTGLLLPEFAADTLEDQIVKHQVVGERVSGGSTYSLTASPGESGQLILAPVGLFTALFRPLLFEAGGFLPLISALEMSFFVVFTCIVLYRLGPMGTFSQVLRTPFLGFCVAFMVVFGTGVGLATTNLGTLARYRMPLIPFFAILLVALLQRSKQTARLPTPAAAARATWPTRSLPSSLPGSDPAR
jgi:hypothetical protein